NVAADDHLEHDELATALAAAHNAGGFRTVDDGAQCATEHPAGQGQYERLKQERSLHVQSREANDSEDSDILAPLADGSEHRIHHAKDAAERHDGSHHDDRD